jgi:hypothetical protein
MSTRAELPNPDAAFLRRRRTGHILTVAWLLVGLWRVPPVPTRWPVLAEVGMWLMILGILPVMGALARSAVCTICGGGIKLDGRTCSKCGHEFPTPSRRPRSQANDSVS